MKNLEATFNNPGNDKKDPSKDIDQSILSNRRSALIGLIAFLVLAILIGAFVYQRYNIRKAEQRDASLTVANNARTRLQESLAYSLSATKTLSFFIQQDGTVKDFDSIAPQILESSVDIDAVQLVPGGIIQQVYPLKGNEVVIGYNILADPARNKEAYKAIEKKELFFAGPFALRQGGMGVVGRLPVYRKGKFWGFTAVIIKMPTLLRSAGIDSSDKTGYYFQLSKINPDTKQEEFFIRHSKVVNQRYSVSVKVPNGEWMLSVVPVKPFKAFRDIMLMSILGFLFAVLGGIFVYSVARRPKRLNQLVKERTLQLKQSEENYKALFEKSPLPLWIYDRQSLKFLEVNDAASNLYGYSREEFLQMDLLKIRPPMEVERFLEDNETNSTDALREAGVWTHIKKNREEIQVLVFARNLSYKQQNGKLVLLMDVSEKMKVEQELIKSEEKYRQLIEQASDGIILYSFDGTIHSFNKSAYTQTGYSKEEFEQLNLKDLFYEDGQVKNRSKDSKIETDKGTTLYRRLKRKDGSLFIVELNARMLPDGKIIAIVRDITEREKYEAALKESEEKFSRSFHASVMGFAIYDADFRIIDVNKAYAGFLEAPSEELIGRLSDEAGLISKIKEENRKLTSDHIQHLLDTTGQLRNLEIEIEGINGVRNLLLSIDPMELNNKPHWLSSAIDITSKKKAEMLLQENEARYRSLIEQASDGIVITNFAGTITEANRSMCNMAGCEESDMIGKNLLDFIPKEDIETIPLRIGDLMEGKSLLYERRLLKKDGTFLSIEVNSKMASANRLIGFIRDISERKMTEEKIRESEEKYRTLVEQASDGIFIADKSGRFIIVNPSGFAMSQYTEHEMMSMTIYDLVLKEDIEKDPFRFDEMSGQRVARAERRLKRKDGTLLDVEVTAKFISGERFLAFVRDISERKKAEEEIRKSNERFELIAQATNEAVWDHDFDKNETWGNTKLFELYGFDPAKDKIDFELFLSRIHPDEREGIERRMIRAMNESVKSLTEEFRFKTSGGGYRDFYDRAYIQYDQEGKPLRILGAMQDITDRETIKKQILKEKELSDSIINSLPGIFYLYNEDRKFLRWNQNFETVTGYSTKEIIKMKPLDLFPEDQKALLAKKIDNVFRLGQDQVEADLLLKNGDRIPYYFTGETIEYEGQKCLMGVGLDFTEKEKAKRLVKESETKYQELIEQASDGIFISDSKGIYTDVNSSACRMLGYSKDELVGMSGKDILYHQDEAGALETRYEEFKTGISYIKETTLKRKDGSPIDVESNSKMLPDGRFIGIVRDLSERKEADKAIRQSEERYRALVDNATEALVVLDVEKQQFVNVSESAEKLFKIPRAELLKLGPVNLSPEFQPDGTLSAESARAHIQDAMEGKNVSFEWTHKDKEGNLIPCEVWLVRLPSDNEVLIRGTIIDITERKKAAEEIRINSELLRELYSYLQNIREEERTHIAREIHDELGQQLTGLKMDLFWINRRLKTEDHAISEKLATTLSLIDTTIKTVRKIATELRPSILDDLGLIAALEWQGEEFEKRADIKVAFDSKLNEAMVLPNIATALFRIYQELLTNIARHAGASHVHTSLYVDRQNLYLKVEDDGIGFDMENVLEKKTLGLKGIKERTNQIGGTYEIKSSPGTGTYVLISVPLHNPIGNSK